MTLRRLAGLLTLALLSACQTTTTAPATTPATTPSGEAVIRIINPEDAPATKPASTGEMRMLDEPTRRMVRLANGTTVILQQNKTAPVVACRVYVRAGSLTENKWMGCGLSHVLEHLVSGASSAKRKEAESTDLLKAIGNDSNAFTTWDNTCYFITTTQEKWPIAIDLLSDWVTNANFTDAEFAREFQVVQREIEMGEAEAERTFAKISYANRYLVHPARHPVVGYKPAFQKLTPADAREYYKMMYVPDNFIVTIAGDIDLAAAEKLVKEKFGPVERKKVPAIDIPAEPPVLAPRTAVAHADVRQARLQLGFPTVDMFSPDMYPLDVLAGALAGGESSVLVRDLRDERGLVSAVSAADETPSWGAGTLSIYMELPADKIPAARRAVLAVLADVKEKGLSAKELEKVKARVAADLIYNNQTAEQQATRNAEDFLATGDVDFSRTYADRIRAVTPEQVQAAAKKYVRDDVLLTTALLPLNAEDNVTRATTQQAAAAAKLPVQKLTLPNGLTVLICKNSAAPVVAMQLYVAGGLLAEDAATNGTGETMMELLTRGAAGRTANDITDFFDSTGGSIAATSGNNTYSLASVCLKQNFAKTFDVFTDLATAPTFAPEELEKIRPLILAGIEHQTEDWFDEGYKLIRDEFFAQSPYKRLPTGSADVVAKLTAPKIRDHYEHTFRNPRQMVLAIYGDINAAPDFQNSAFAKLKPVDVKLNLETQDAPPHRITHNTDKASATVMIAFGPGSVAGGPDRDAIVVLQTLLGGYNSPGGSLLHETLRGKGLVYTVQASNIPGVQRAGAEARGLFLISALGEPENADQIVTLIEKIVADVKAGKVSDADFASAKDQAITGHQLQNQTIAAQAQDQALDELSGLGYNDSEAFPARVKAITKADLIRAANKYLNDPVIALTLPKKESK